MLEIISAENSKIKKALKLRDSRERKKTGEIIIEGAREISLALNGGIIPKTLFYCAELEADETPDLFGISQEKVLLVAKNIFNKISARENPDGLLMVSSAPQTGIENIELSKNPLIIVLEAVEKPGNLGAVMRTADAAGADAVMVADPKTDIYNPNAIRASQGSIFTVPVCAENSKTIYEWLCAKKINIFCAAIRNDAIEYTAADFSKPTALLFGPEDKGLSNFWIKNGKTIYIPMRGKIDSLNVSVSAGIIVFEALRQRNKFK
jgi:RNA methyltransferase, TrmH family